jgi:glycerol-3-phosphate O-acyltransferase
MVEELVSEVKPAVIRMIAWTVHKAFKNMFEKININMDMLEELREIEKNSELPIVLLPTHRSYFDFLIVSYIFFIYKLRLPNFVADEVLLQAELLPFLVKSSGAFFFQRLLYAKSGLYRVVFDKYLELLLREGSTLQFFIEGSRSRTGKILAPKLEVLNVVLDTLLFGKVADVYLIPLTINYEKVPENDFFPSELLSEEKVAESFKRVIRASFVTKINYGRVYVEICKPMTVRPFVDTIQQQNSQLKG